MTRCDATGLLLVAGVLGAGGLLLLASGVTLAGAGVAAAAVGLAACALSGDDGKRGSQNPSDAGRRERC
jgi:hypothetical protein